MKLALLSILFVHASYSYSQEWKQMARDPQINIYDVVIEAEAYFDTIDIKAKGSGWKGYQRWLYENEKRYARNLQTRRLHHREFSR